MPGVASRQRKKRHPLLWPVVTLATWLLRRTWFLLLFITLGMVAAVVIVCTIPLLSEEMTTAGLRNTLRSTPDSDEIVVYAGDPAIATPIVQAAYNQFAPLFQRYLGNTVQQTQSSIIVNDFSFSPQRKNVHPVIYGTAMQQAATHFGKVDGRIAGIINQSVHEIEVMMTPTTARRLGLHVGSSFSLSFNYFTANPATSYSEPPLYSAIITAHLVGLFQVTAGNIAYWHGDDFNPITLATEGTAPQYQDTIVVSADALLTLFDHLRTLHQADAVYSTSSAGYTFAWYYHFLPSHLTGSDLNSLIQGITGLQFTMNSLYGDLQSIASASPSYPYLSSLGLSGSVLNSNGQTGSLEQLRARIDVARIPAGIFTILIVLLILFFVSLMTVLLVERQIDSIALLRSRGASSGQIFGSLFLQSSILSLIALLVGIPLAIYITLLLGQHILASKELDALNIITTNPWQVMLGTMPYALVVIVVVLITMGISLFSAVRMDVLSLRRASTRSNKRPLWQRLNLDVIAEHPYQPGFFNLFAEDWHVFAPV